MEPDLIPLGNVASIFKQAAERYCGTFDTDKENSLVINELLMWLERSVNFNGNRRGQLYDTAKGLLLMGNPGTGKTTLLEIAMALLRKTCLGFKKLSVPAVIDQFSCNGPEYLKSLIGNIFFDDLGFERPAVHYGDKRELMQDVIFSRYDQMRYYGWMTHFTTMSTKDELLNRYGEFAWSRLQQMCNIFVLGGASDSKDRRLSRTCPAKVNIELMPRLYITKQELQNIEENKKMREVYKKQASKPITPHQGMGTRLKKILGFTDEKDKADT